MSGSRVLSLDLNCSDISTHPAQPLPEGFPGKGPTVWSLLNVLICTFLSFAQLSSQL